MPRTATSTRAVRPAHSQTLRLLLRFVATLQLLGSLVWFRSLVRRAMKVCSIQIWRLNLGVFSEYPEDLALDAYICCGCVDGSHLRVGRLQADHVAFAVETFQGGVGSVDEGDDDLSLAGGTSAFD